MPGMVDYDLLISKLNALTITSPTTTALSAQNTTGATISVVILGTAVPLPTKPYVSGFTANGSNTVFTAQITGKYYISYNIKTTVGLALSSGVYVNGVNKSNLACEPGILATSFSGQAIVSLSAGDTVQLTMYGLLGGAILQGGAGATMNVIRIG